MVYLLFFEVLRYFLDGKNAYETVSGTLYKSLRS
mgnify:CR=1 FL=1